MFFQLSLYIVIFCIVLSITDDSKEPFTKMCPDQKLLGLYEKYVRPPPNCTRQNTSHQNASPSKCIPTKMRPHFKMLTYEDVRAKINALRKNIFPFSSIFYLSDTANIGHQQRPS